MDDILYLLKYDSAHGKLKNTEIEKLSEKEFKINNNIV